ncbi:DUF4328 domain-containing protein [Sphingomonas corticis]|uniref:DUF4328 domain-containing protein n=1 Tax=Sphingomonas corticis TaxID=2722791 RepID=A0ABX1CNH2_9SPHN|nr:DUF4328 domain-containing protein [Sphingomonas corticis]
MEALALRIEIMMLSAMIEDGSRRFTTVNADAPLTGTEIAALVYMLASIICGILVFRWIYVAGRNAHAFSAAMTMPPDWNVGWFFVAVGNLWKPFQGVREA